MRKAISKSLAFLLILGLIFSVGIAMGETAAAPVEKAQWTVLLYLCGTDLESNHGMASYNLQEIAKTSPNDQVHFVMETGGTNQWQTEEAVGLKIASDKLQRYHYDADGFMLDQELPLDNMAAASTLTDFIQWGAQNYPAEKYLLVLWDHGGGSVSGMICDEMHGNAIMPLDQLEVAMKDAAVPMEAVMLDTCLMATLETAQALQSSTKYLIASQEVVPGCGSAYEAWLQYLYNNPSCDGARFGRVACDAIQQKYAELGMSYASRMLTFAVIDLSRMDAVSAAFDKMVLELGKLLEDPERFYFFGYFTQHMQRYYDTTMVDLADMASRAGSNLLSRETASEVIEAVDSAVLYSIKGDQRSYSHGLSFYYEPSANMYKLDHYARVCKSAPYLAFLDATSMKWSAPAWVYQQTPRLKDISYQDYSVTADVNLAADGLPLLTVTNAPHAVANVEAVLYQYEKSSGSWLLLGDSDQVVKDYAAGVFTMDFPASWYTLNGNFCNMTIVEESLMYTLYSIPFMVEKADGEQQAKEFRVAYVLDDQPGTSDQDEQTENDTSEEYAPWPGHFEFYGVWDSESSSGSSLPSRDTQELSAYYGLKIFTYLSRHSDPGMDAAGEAASKPYTLDASLTMDEKALPKGDYAMMFKVTDVFGAQQWMQPIYVTWNGKQAVYSGVEPLPEQTAEEEVTQ
ncbi:MAG: clostripain-related cysteine peptidase [Eubacteriales bacterium]|nr:clostripain-related cysteine peptidase [Eubacteriales bacterium]